VLFSEAITGQSAWNLKGDHSESSIKSFSSVACRAIPNRVADRLGWISTP